MRFLFLELIISFLAIFLVSAAEACPEQTGLDTSGIQYLWEQAFQSSGLSESQLKQNVFAAQIEKDYCDDISLLKGKDNYAKQHSLAFRLFWGLTVVPMGITIAPVYDTYEFYPDVIKELVDNYKKGVLDPLQSDRFCATAFAYQREIIIHPSCKSQGERLLRDFISYVGFGVKSKISNAK